MCSTVLKTLFLSWAADESETSGLLSPERGAGGGAPEEDGSRQQQVQTSHHNRRTLEKGLNILKRFEHS